MDSLVNTRHAMSGHCSRQKGCLGMVGQRFLGLRGKPRGYRNMTKTSCGGGDRPRRVKE